MRNLAQALRRCMKNLSGEDFDSYGDFEDWLVENYIMVHRKIAELNGTNQDVAERKARAELPPLKAKVEAERKKIEEELAEERRKSK